MVGNIAKNVKNCCFNRLIRLKVEGEMIEVMLREVG